MSRSIARRSLFGLLAAAPLAVVTPAKAVPKVTTLKLAVDTSEMSRAIDAVAAAARRCALAPLDALARMEARLVERALDEIEMRRVTRRNRL